MSREFERVRAAIIRGGTSKGAYIMANELPSDLEKRDKVLLSIYGSPDTRQIDGIGGADPLTSKVAIIQPSSLKGIDVDYTFGQVSIDKPLVDYNSNCGNISSGVGPFAIDEGLVPAVEPITKVTIFNTNTKKIIEAEVPVKDGKALTQGDCEIPGVPGKGAKIMLNFPNCDGSKTGALLPTGNPKDTLQLLDGSTIDVSYVDAAAPAVFIKAQDLGLTGTELPSDIEGNEILSETLEYIRAKTAELFGFVKSYKEAATLSPTVPKIIFVGAATTFKTLNDSQIEERKISLVARQISMQKMHKAYPVTGGICTSTAALIEGTVVNEVYENNSDEGTIVIGHPSGTMEFNIGLQKVENEFKLTRAAVARTSRRIFEGLVYLPSNVFWDDEKVDELDDAILVKNN